MYSGVLASSFRVYDEKLFDDKDFMAGWRLWSFHKTRKGEHSDVKRNDTELIALMKQKGRELNAGFRDQLNQFRSDMLSIFPIADKTMHFHEQYRHIFKRVAFVVIDCCFAIKYQMDKDSLRQVLIEMFKGAGDEVPSVFVILENDITDSELNHKLHQDSRVEYRGTQDKILAYRAFKPTLRKDGIAKARVPFLVAHEAMMVSERKVLRKMRESRKQGESRLYSRAGINDFSLIFMIDKIRRCFGLCARVALLTDDFAMLQYASSFYSGKLLFEASHAPSRGDKRYEGAPPSVLYPNLPRSYHDPYIVTPHLLDATFWNEWRRNHVHPFFADHISDL